MQEGYKHAEGVSEQLLAGVDYIRAKRPLAFVFERLRAFTWGSYRPCFHKLLKMLKGIKDTNGGATYQVQWRCLDVYTHGGLPMSRPRVFIIGVTRASRASVFAWPRKCDAIPLGVLLDGPATREQASSPDLSGYSDVTVINLMSGMQRILARGGKPLTQAWVIDCKSDQPNAIAKGKLPCLSRPGNRGRAGGAGLFVTNQGRMIRLAEMLRLAGIDPLRLHVPPNVSEAQFLAMVRATVCVPMLARVAINLCKALGIVPKHEQACGNQPIMPCAAEPDRGCQRLCQSPYPHDLSGWLLGFQPMHCDAVLGAQR